MPEIQGKDIKEVWDSKLSTATPLIDKRSGTWVAQIWAKSNPDFDPSNPQSKAEPLEEFDTGIKAEIGDEYDVEKIKPCFEWLKSRRDAHALPEIEGLKPALNELRAAEAEYIANPTPETFAARSAASALFNVARGIK